MWNYSAKSILVFVAFLLFATSDMVIAQEPPADVAGNWTIHSKGPDGKYRTQSIQVTQQGGVITGHYQATGQEGKLEGTINEQHILFRTKTGTELTFRGRVDGARVERIVQGRTKWDLPRRAWRGAREGGAR